MWQRCVDRVVKRCLFGKRVWYLSVVFCYNLVWIIGKTWKFDHNDEYIMKGDYQLSNHNQKIDYELLRPDVFIWNKVPLFARRFLFNRLAKDNFYIYTWDFTSRFSTLHQWVWSWEDFISLFVSCVIKIGWKLCNG